MDGVTTPDAPPAYGPYLPYQPPPPLPVPDPRKRWALIVVTVVWALLLGVSAIWYSWHGRPTAREQTTIASAEPTVTEAIQAVVRAAGASVVPAFSGFEKAGDCEVTAARSGMEYRRVLWLYTPVGSEPAVLDRIADGLPDRYAAKSFHSPGGAVHTLSADAGNFVMVSGTVLLPGLVRVRAETGCRTLGDLRSADPTTAPTTSPATAPATAPGENPLGENPLGVTGSWQSHTLPCGLRTVMVTGPASRSFSTLPGPGSVVSTPQVWAAKDGRAAHTESGQVTWTVTTGTC